MGNRGEHSFHALKVKLGWSILWSRLKRMPAGRVVEADMAVLAARHLDAQLLACNPAPTNTILACI